MNNKLMLTLLSMGYLLQAEQEYKNIDTDIEQQDLEAKRTNFSSRYTSVSNKSDISMPMSPSAGIPAFVELVGVAPSKPDRDISAVDVAGSLGGVAGSPSAAIAATNAAASLNNDNPPAPEPDPSNRVIANAQSNSALVVTAASLTGATYNFSGFTGAATGGTFSLGGTTLSSTTGVQDTGTTGIGTLTYQFGNLSGAASYSNINLTGGTIVNATITGSTSGDYFTGTNFTTGSISVGNFDIVFVEFPVGTVFNIVNGDLGTTGTFTTTATGYGYVTGTNNISSITNGTVTLVGTVDGTFNYLDTNITGGSLATPIYFTGVYAAGAATDANHFEASTATGTIGNGTVIVINRTLATTQTGVMYIADGTASAGELITGLSGVAGTISGGTFSSSTGLTGGTLLITSSCIDGENTSIGAIYLSTPSVASYQDVSLSGSMAGSVNSVEFTATEILTGTISGLTSGPGDFQAGSCP